MGKSIVGLKEKLLTKGVYLQTEVEFSIFDKISDDDLSDQDLLDKEYRFIRLGFAAMNETEVIEGLAIIMTTLYATK